MSHLIQTRERDDETGDIIAPGIIRCDCGAKLEAWDHHDVDCDRCQREYNSAGQLLAPRSQWGEETGECAADYDQGVAEGDAYPRDRP